MTFVSSYCRAAFALLLLASLGACAPLPTWPTDAWSHARVQALDFDLPADVTRDAVETTVDGAPVHVDVVTHEEPSTDLKSGLVVAVLAFHLETGSFRADPNDGRALADSFAERGMRVDRVARVETAGLPGYELEGVVGSDGGFVRGAHVISRYFYDRTTLYMTFVAFVDAPKVNPIGSTTATRLSRSLSFVGGAPTPADAAGSISGRSAVASGAAILSRKQRL